MDYEKYNEKMQEFINRGISCSTDDREIELFYEFIDKLEELAQSAAKYYGLLADCYWEIRDVKKAKMAFEKVYNPKNKKHLKKLYEYDTIILQPIVRPSKRAKNLPEFRYADKEVISNLFEKADNESCIICGKKNSVQYCGMAYKNMKDSPKEIYYAYEKERFCAECLANGTASDKYHITFNDPALQDWHEKIDEDKRQELLYRTPSCSEEFYQANEDIWPTHCDDFCCYIKRDNDRFYFKCLHCGKIIVWKEFT